MSDFERIYQTDPSRESFEKTEKHPSIEISDKEYLEKKSFIKLINKFPLIENNLEIPMIKEEKMNEESKSKSVKQKPKRNDKKAKQTTMARIQKEL